MASEPLCALCGLLPTRPPQSLAIELQDVDRAAGFVTTPVDGVLGKVSAHLWGLAREIGRNYCVWCAHAGHSRPRPEHLSVQALTQGEVARG